MRGYMFRNRWFALLFVCLTLAGVTKLVGTDRESGAIQEAAGQLAETRAQAEQFSSATQEPAAEITDEPDVMELASDEDLIDPAVGEDPTPADDFIPDDMSAEEPSDEVVIVSNEVPAAEP